MTEPEPGNDGSGERRRESMFALMYRFSRLWGFLLFVAVLLLLFRAVVLPFVLGGLIAYLLEPVVRRMATKVGRGLSVILVYLVLFGLMVGFFGGLLPGVVSDLAKLRDSTPEAVATFNEDWLPKASEWFDETFPGVVEARGEGEPELSEITVEPQADGSYKVDLREAHLEVRESAGGWTIEADAPRQTSFGDILRELVANKGDELTQVATDAVRAVVTGIAGFLTDFVIAFLVAAVMLIDIERIQRFIRSLIPPDHREDFDELAAGIDEGMAGVVRGQILICIVNGVLTWIGLAIVGVKYALLLAMIAGSLSIIPVFGILIATIPVLGVALISGELGLQGLAFGKSAIMLGWLVGIHLLEANYLNPKVIGVASNIHPVVLIFALLAGLSTAGLLGLVLAIPVASVVQTGFLYARKRSDLFNPRVARAEKKGKKGRKGKKLAASGEGGSEGSGPSSPPPAS